MNLHVESSGRGESLVLLHGWGMHGGVWSDVAEKLAADFRVHSVDLPGYGRSAMIHLPPQEGMAIAPSLNGGGLGRGSILAESETPTLTLMKQLAIRLGLPTTSVKSLVSPRSERGLDSLDFIVDHLSVQFSEPLTVCGWSLGGQIALRWAAREPDKVRRLILVASTPCFTERDNWLFGMAREVLEKFAAELEQNHAATLRRFIALQLRGSENERELTAMLRDKLFSRGKPDMGALRAGLNILRDTDQRSDLLDIKQPTMIIAGERDKLTPPEASYYMAQVISSARVVEIEGAAHAPFLSHPEVFVEQLKSFLHE